MSATRTTGKAQCVRCGKERSAVRCEGCSQTFCYDHLADHRQELSHQLDEIETGRDLFRQALNLHTTGQQKDTLIQQIDHWKIESIEKIEQAAEECKNLVLKHITERTGQVEIKLSKLTEDLKYIRRENDYNDVDLMQLSARLEQLTKQLDQPENIIVDQNSASLVKGITIKVSSSKQAFATDEGPIAIPTAFLVQSCAATEDSTLSSETKHTIPGSVTNILVDTPFKSSLYESEVGKSLPVSSTVSTPLAATAKSPPQPTPIAFFSVNRSDNVIIYFDQTYQHHMIYTCLPTLHFIHSDSFELLHIHQNQMSSQSEENNSNNAAIIDSTSSDRKNLSTNNRNLASALVDSTKFGINGLNLSTTPLLARVTDKEYCEAKRPGNRFNVPLGTKFYRIRVQPWKPSISFSSN